MVAIRKEIFLRLKSEIPFFHGFRDEEMLAFLRLMTAEHFKADHTVVKEFDQGDKMYILFSGEVEITKRVGQAEGMVKETTMTRLKPGEAFGELGILDHRPRSATARAIEASMLFSITSEKLERIAKNPKYAFLSYKLFRNFATMLASRLRDTNQKVVTLESQRLSL